MGGFEALLDAMVKVSVIQVRWTPLLARLSSSEFCSGVGSSKTRRERSAAISVREPWLQEHIVEGAAEPADAGQRSSTPTATARITNPNLNDDARASRQAILQAVDQVKFIATLH